MKKNEENILQINHISSGKYPLKALESVLITANQIKVGVFQRVGKTIKLYKSKLNF